MNARYREVWTVLREEILQGRYAASGAFPSSVQLARRFNTTRAKFLRMAEKLGLSPQMMDREIGRLQTRVERQAPKVAEELSVRYPSPCYARIVSGIFQRSSQLSNR